MRIGFLVSAVLLAGAACDRAPEPSGPRARASLIAAGDVASCWWRSDEATARLIDRMDGVVAALGDLVYQAGTEDQYRDCYVPTWGRHVNRTRPTLGNHDRRTRRGAAYYRLFGARAGEPGKGWYSYDLDGWHVVVLNSEEDMKPGSPQLRWLEADLRAHPTPCTLAYMHRPLFSSGKHGGSARVRDAWRVLYAGGVDVVLAGHDHHYERFAALTPDGERDPARGIVSFVIGTGGAPLYAVDQPGPHSLAHQNRVHGVVAFRFAPGRYEWEFVPVRGAGYADRGTASCH
ncbi:MAG TPA: metallophosphoesterase [Longimicrobium sp.]|nr:metallophosphoesterase [Longimicrobium sp.]